MQTLFHAPSSRYTLAPTRNVGDFSAKLAKCTGKSRKSAIRDLRTKGNFPKFEAGMSTADYVKMFEAWGTPCKPVEWEQLNDEPCTLYSGADTCETLPAGFDTWEDFDAAQSPETAPESTMAAANDDAAPTVPDPEPAARAVEVIPFGTREAFDAATKAAAETLLRLTMGEAHDSARSALIERGRYGAIGARGAIVDELKRLSAAKHWHGWREAQKALYTLGAAESAPVAAPIETAPAEVAPPGYAIEDAAPVDPLPTQSDSVPVPGKLESDPVPGNSQPWNPARDVPDEWKDPAAFTESDWPADVPRAGDPVPPATQPDTVPVPGKLAPVRPDYVNQWDAWLDVRNGRADPDAYQGHVIECMEAALATGLFYNSQTWPAAAELMFERHHYPDWRDSSADNGVARFFGTDCYNAHDIIRKRAAAAADKAAADGFHAGQKFARLMFNDYKLCTGAVLHSLTHTGKECRLTGKRAGRAFEVTCTATTLQNAIERAAERAAQIKAKRARAKPAPAARAPIADPVPSKSEPDPVPPDTQSETGRDSLRRMGANDYARGDAMRGARSAPEQWSNADWLAYEEGYLSEQAKGNPVPGDTIPADNPRDPAPVVEPYRYARGAVVARCKSPDDFKTRAARLAEHCRMRWVRRAGGYVGTVRQSDKLLRLFAEGRDASVITGELYPLETAEPAPCEHPPARLYAGHAKNADGVTRPWVACCDCGDVLTGGAPSDADEDDETIPAPLDGLDVAELDDMVEFERAGGIAQPIAPAYRDDVPRATPTPSLRISPSDPRARIPARFAPVYLLQA